MFAPYFAGDGLKYQTNVCFFFFLWLVPGVMLTHADNTPHPVLWWSFNSSHTHNPAVVTHKLFNTVLHCNSQVNSSRWTECHIFICSPLPPTTYRPMRIARRVWPPSHVGTPWAASSLTAAPMSSSPLSVCKGKDSPGLFVLILRCTGFIQLFIEPLDAGLAKVQPLAFGQ